MDIDDLADHLGSRSRTTRWTPSGLIAKLGGRVPILGSTAEIAGLKLTAERMEGRRHASRPSSSSDCPRPRTRRTTDDRCHHATRRAVYRGVRLPIGRPNAGKSTPTNALVGRRSRSRRRSHRRPGTRSVGSSPATSQLIPSTRGAPRSPGDPPGRAAQRPRARDPARRRRHRVLPAGRPAGGPRGPVHRRRTPPSCAGPSRTPVVAIATKGDRVDRKRLAEHLIAVDQLGTGPTSCRARRPPATRSTPWPQCSPAPAELAGPLSRRCHHRRAGLVAIAELVREAALEGVRDELPHSLAVVVEIVSARSGLLTSR